MTDKIEATALILVKPGSADEFERLLQNFESATNAEDGCIEFRFFRDTENTDQFVLWEIFENQQALSTHMELPHTKAVFSKGLIQSTRVIKHSRIT